jgi:hypothetical protein
MAAPPSGATNLPKLDLIAAAERYRVVLSLELFNRKYWSQDASEVARTGLAKMMLVVKEAGI